MKEIKKGDTVLITSVPIPGHLDYMIGNEYQIERINCGHDKIQNCLINNYWFGVAHFEHLIKEI